MDEVFIDQITKALKLARKRDFIGLGQLEISHHPLIDSFLREELGDMEIENVTTYLRGEAMYGFIIDLIEKELKPIGQEDLQQPDWQTYNLLKKHYILRQDWRPVARELAVSRTSYFDLRGNAINRVASAWRNWETALRRQPFGVKGNWGEIPDPYTHFIRRKDPKTNKYYDELIIEELVTGKAWVITLVGSAGVGKTALAHRAGDICYDQQLFNAIVGITLKGELLNAWSGRVFKISRIDKVLTHFYERLGIALNERKVLTVSSLEAKRAINLKAIRRHRRVLIVLDNLEVLLDKTQEDALQHIQRFFYELPRPCKVLATSRGQPQVGEHQFRIPGMQREEAFAFMHEVMSKQGIPPFEDHILASIHEATKGSPLQMQRAIARMVLDQETPEEALLGQGQEELEYLYDDIPSRLNERQEKILCAIHAVPDPIPSDGISKVSSIPEFLMKRALEDLAFQALIQSETVEHPNGEIDLYKLTPQFQTYVSEYWPGGKLLGSTDSAVWDHVLEQWAKHFRDTLADLPAHLRLEGQSVVDNQVLFLKYQKDNVFYIMEWLFRKFERDHKGEDGKLFLNLMHLLGRPLGLLGYKERKVEFGANASGIALALGNDRLAALFEVYDVIWSLQRWPTPETELMTQKLKANLGEAIKRWPDPGPKWAARKLEKVLEEAVKMKWPEIEALARRQLGKHLRNEGLLRESLVQLDQSRKIFQDLAKIGKSEIVIDATTWVVSLLIDIGDLSLLMNDYAEARENYEEIVNEPQNLNISKSEFSEVLCSLAMACNLDGDEDKAKQYFDEARRELQGINPIAPCWAHYYFQLGQIEQQKGNYKSARRNYEKAKEILLALGMERSARYEQLEQVLASLDGTE